MAAHVADGEDGVAATVSDVATHLTGPTAVGKGQRHRSRRADLVSEGTATLAVRTLDGGNGCASLHHIDGAAVPAVVVAVGDVSRDVAGGIGALRDSADGRCGL